MEKTLKLNLQADGKLTVVGHDESLGFQSETKATTLRISLPKNLASTIQHYVEFLAPSGDSKSSAQLEKHVDPSDNSDYIEVPLETPLIQEAGRYAVQYVGRDLTNEKCIKSEIIALEVGDSINAGNNMEDTNPDWIAWAENKLNNHEDRIAALENGEDAEVHSDGVGIRDGEIVVKDSTGPKKIKGSRKTLEEVHTQAVSAATQIAAADATQKASSAQTAAIAAASVDASQKAATAKSEAIAAAASDATSKAATAKSEAITAAGIDASQKAATAKSEAISAASADASSKASAAQAAAEATASADATAKVAAEAARAQTAEGQKQATLVSGVNIKTINGESILGPGNIVIQGGGGDIPEATIAEIDALFPEEEEE